MTDTPGSVRRRAFFLLLRDSVIVSTVSSTALAAAVPKGKRRWPSYGNAYGGRAT